MTLATWFAFAAASSVMLLIPGPTALLVVSHALKEGRRAALPTVAGVTLGDFLAMTLSMIGLGAILSTSAGLFTVFKFAGAAYLIFLGIKFWRSKPALAGEGDIATARSGLFAHAFVVTALNPKSIIFFIAFLPQFVDPGAAFLPQMLVLEVTFLMLSASNAAFYMLAAERARSAFAHPGLLRAVNRASGTLLIGAGLLTATLRRV